MKYVVILEHGDTSWGAHVPDLPGCIAAGTSREEVLSLIAEAIDLHIESMLEAGEEIPKSRSETATIETHAA